MDDQTLEGGASENAENLELAPTTSTEDETELGGDPLDEISDVAARELAKKHRAIARRLEKKAPEEKPEMVKPAPSQEYLTKADYYKSNERKAIKEATADPEVKANWAEIIPFYTPRRGKETAEDIREDINDAITLYNARNTTVSKDDSANQLKTTPVVKTGGGTTVATAQKTPNPPNFKLPTQPKDWYKK
jgi:hypothetical protein